MNRRLLVKLYTSVLLSLCIFPKISPASMCDVSIAIKKFPSGQTYFSVDGVAVTGPIAYPTSFALTNLQTSLEELTLAITYEKQQVLLVAEGFSELLPLIVSKTANSFQDSQIPIQSVDPLYGPELEILLDEVVDKGEIGQNQNSVFVFGVRNFFTRSHINGSPLLEAITPKALNTEYHQYLVQGDAKALPDNIIPPDLYLNHLLVNNITLEESLNVIDEAIRITNHGGEIKIFGFELDLGHAKNSNANDNVPFVIFGDQEVERSSEDKGNQIEVITSHLTHHPSNRVLDFQFIEVEQTLNNKGTSGKLLHINIKN